MTNVGRKEFKLAKTHRKADAAKAKKKVSLSARKSKHTPKGKKGS